MKKRSEEITAASALFVMFEVVDCCETEGHREYHNYRSNPQLFAEGRQEILQIKISKLYPTNIHGNAEK
jgi:hypothetical protein